MSSLTGRPRGIGCALADVYGCHGSTSRASWDQLRARLSARSDPSSAPLESARELPPGVTTSRLARTSASGAVSFSSRLTSIGPATVMAFLKGSLVYVTPPSWVELSLSAQGSPLPLPSAIAYAGRPV